MKATTKLTGLFLIILLSFSVTLNAQRGMRGNGMQPDSLRMRGMRSQMVPGRMAQVNNFNNHRQVYDMRQGRRMGPGSMAGMGRGMGHGQMAPNNRGMGNVDRNGWGPMSSGRLITESLPNVTEKQKKDIADLRLKQQDEMKKFREETTAKMKTLREDHNKAVLNVLTDEQKKFIESKQVKPIDTPVPAK